MYYVILSKLCVPTNGRLQRGWEIGDKDERNVILVVRLVLEYLMPKITIL